METKTVEIGAKYTSGGTTSEYIMSELGAQSIAVKIWTGLESIEKGERMRTLIVTSVNNHDKLKEALEKMCAWHELQATWDKGDNGYYAAKSLLRSLEADIINDKG